MNFKKINTQSNVKKKKIKNKCAVFQTPFLEVVCYPAADNRSAGLCVFRVPAKKSETRRLAGLPCCLSAVGLHATTLTKPGPQQPMVMRAPGH